MVLTGYFALSPVIGLFVTVASEKYFANLNASVEASGPHGFTVRISAFVKGAYCVHRISPRVRDDREPPLLVGRDGNGCRDDLGVAETGKFWRKRLDSEANQRVR